MGVARQAKMKLLFLAWLHLSGPGQPGVLAQCDAELPSQNPCAQEDFFVEADPEACSFFYECSEGCVSHKQCQPHEDGLPRVFDDVFEWCGLTDEVDCGTRPCKDPIECATQVTRTTATTTEDCGHPFDCSGNGFFPDPFNCRKYWQCYGGGHGEHFLCPDDPATGEPEVFDLVFDGCNSSGSQHFFCADGLVYEATKVMCDFPERVNCRGCGPLGSCNRPTCDCCDDNCHF